MKKYLYKIGYPVWLLYCYLLRPKMRGVKCLIEHEGKFLLKGNKYKLEIAGQEIISYVKTMWTYIKDANELHINDAPDPGEAESSGAITPVNILNMYEKGFKYKFDSEGIENWINVQIINLMNFNKTEQNRRTDSDRVS
jgi:outer membrane lipoprotein carrier protein